MQITELIKSVQKILNLQEDGKAGPETWSAIYSALVATPAPGTTPEISLSPVDTRSEKSIGTLLPEVQPFARALVQKAAAGSINIKIISGLRTYAEQDALYAKGRTAPGPTVTNATGGRSNHNFGIAFDIGVFSGNSYLSGVTQVQGRGRTRR